MIKWRDLPEAESSWEDIATVRDLYPSLQLEDELVQQAGRDVMVSIAYRRRPKQSNNVAG